jgi:hypothetical protein
MVRRTLPEAVVPYLRMSGRWLEEHGFAIGSGVRVLVEPWARDADQWRYGWRLRASAVAQ